MENNLNCRSFAPVYAPDATVLILGSMPGVASLRQQQYYAHRYNTFWQITGELYHFDFRAPYLERLAALQHAKVALWDVLASCRRIGSLDTAINQPVPNALASLLEQCRHIDRICCNGATAGKLFKRFFPQITLPILILPSTSPAAARLSYEAKLSAYRTALLEPICR